MSKYDENNLYRQLKGLFVIDPYRIYYFFGPHYIRKRKAALEMLRHAEEKFFKAKTILNDFSYDSVKDDLIIKYMPDIPSLFSSYNRYTIHVLEELVYISKVCLEHMRNINYGKITIFPESYDYICRYLSKIAYIGMKLGHPLPADYFVKTFEDMYYESPITKYVLEEFRKFTFIFMKIRDNDLLSSDEYRNMIKNSFSLLETDEDVCIYSNIYLDIYRYAIKKLRNDMLHCYFGNMFTFYDYDFDVELVMGTSQ